MKDPHVLFVLPVGGGGGGANSVAQEAAGLARLGIQAEIVINKQNYPNFLRSYPELQQLQVSVGAYESPSNLAQHMAEFDIVVATTNASVFEVNSALKDLSKKTSSLPRIAYYVQDYEPLFYAPGSKEWKVAYGSYDHIRDATLFAKTDWVRNIVYDNHGIRVLKVRPSIDHRVFYPNLRAPREQLAFAAMVRPQTPRRAPRRTIRILEMLAEELGDGTSLQVFGAKPNGLEVAGLSLSSSIENRGTLRRQEVADLLRVTDMFLDLSDYQAFGRTGLESMACGCIPIVPLLGGTAEYAVHGWNAYVVDTRSDDAILEAVRHFVHLSSDDRREMQWRALETATEFTVEKAALSLLRLFNKIASDKNGQFDAAGVSARG